MMRVSLFLAMALSVLISSPAVQAQTYDNVAVPTPSAVSAMSVAEQKIPLSLNSAILYALSDNPDVRMALKREDQTVASTGKAESRLYPIVDFVVEGGYEHNEPATGVASGGHTNDSNHFNLTVQQLIYDFNRTGATIEQQKQLEYSAKLDTQVKVEETMNAAIEHYLDILEFQENLKTQTAFVERIRQLVGTVGQMFEAGASNKAMRDYADSRLAAAETDNNTIRANLKDAQSNLEYLTGPLPPFEVGTPTDLDPTQMDLKRYLAMAEEQNSGLQLNRSDLKAMTRKLEVAKAALYPTINLVASYDEKHDDGGLAGRDAEAQAYLQLTHRLYDGGERSNDIKLTRAQLQEGEINEEKVIKELRRLIKQAYNQIVSVQESRKQTLKEIASSEALQVINRQNFEQGSINVIELIEGEERLNAARSKLNTLNSELYLNTYRLLITSGLLKQGYFCGTCDAPQQQQASVE